MRLTGKANITEGYLLDGFSKMETKEICRSSVHVRVCVAVCVVYLKNLPNIFLFRLIFLTSLKQI